MATQFHTIARFSTTEAADVSVDPRLFATQEAAVEALAEDWNEQSGCDESWATDFDRGDSDGVARFVSSIGLDLGFLITRVTLA